MSLGPVLLGLSFNSLLPRSHWLINEDSAIPKPLVAMSSHLCRSSDGLYALLAVCSFEFDRALTHFRDKELGETESLDLGWAGCGLQLLLPGSQQVL